jgi:hypothetical protein
MGFGLFKSNNVYDGKAAFSYSDGYFIIEDKLTFDKIRQQCVPMKHLLVDGCGVKRLYLGFNRNGSLVTDTSAGDGSTSWREPWLESWMIEPYEGGL